MCGIAGIFARDRARIDRARVERMRDQLEARGPDAAGLYVDDHVGLGHRRLSIIDISAGHQPMANASGTVQVIFNGEIYNHVELRAVLEGLGHRYQTRCDTESILHVYEEFGEAGFERLEGMFAFALWDALNGRLFLVRDRLGIKPLYYAETERELLFASEIKSLMAAGLRARFNAAALPELLANRYIAGDETSFEGVRRVLPGHVMTWRTDGTKADRAYWQLTAPAELTHLGFREAATDLRGRLEAAVQRHLMSDVPLGVFLSGGLDSSALAAIAARQVSEPLRTFSVGFADEDSNELPYARQVAAAIGAQHQDVIVSPDAFVGALPHLIWRQDEPMAFSSGVPLYFVSALARRDVKVVLTGEGADELFLGYNRYRVAYWNSQLARPYAAVTPPPLRRAIRRGVDMLPAKIRRMASRSFLAYEPGPYDQFFENFSVFPARLRASVLATDVAERDPFHVGQQHYEGASGATLWRMSATDLQTYLCELLMKQDRMSMAASIESRVPFLDDRLVAHVAALPTSLKLRGWTTKAVLRKAIADLLPPQILTRKKMGFPVPFGRWLRGAHAPLIKEFVLSGRTLERGLLQREGLERIATEHRTGVANHGERLWILINLEIWQRIYCDGDAPADVFASLRHTDGRAYGHHLDQDGRAVAAQYRRPPTHVSDSLGVVGAAPRVVAHHGGA